MIGETLTVTIDRPMGTYHPERPEIFYTINYGYVAGLMAPDGEEQDVYVLGIDHPIPVGGRVTLRHIATVHRYDDVEEKWVGAPDGMPFSRDDIAAAIAFQEHYHDSVILLPGETPPAR